MPSAAENLRDLLSAVRENNRNKVNLLLLFNEGLNVEAARIKLAENGDEKSYGYHLLLEAARKEDSKIFELLINNYFFAHIPVSEIRSLLQNCQTLGIKERPKTMLATVYMVHSRENQNPEGMVFARQFGVAQNVELRSILYNPYARLAEGYVRLSDQQAQPARHASSASHSTAPQGGARRNLMNQFNEVAASASAAAAPARAAAAPAEPEPKRQRVEDVSDRQKKERAQILYGMGNSLLGTQPVEAFTHFMEAVKVFNDHGNALFSMGNMLTDKSIIIPDDVRKAGVELIKSLSEKNNIIAKVMLSQINQPSNSPASEQHSAIASPKFNQGNAI